MFDDEMESMFCSACRTFAKTDQDKKGPFVVGANKFKLENIKAHELSKSHFFFFFKLALTTKTNLSLTHRQACACSNSCQLNAKR